MVLTNGKSDFLGRFIFSTNVVHGYIYFYLLKMNPNSIYHPGNPLHTKFHENRFIVLTFKLYIQIGKQE